MAQKRKTNQTETVFNAALALASKGGWDSLTLPAVAKKARVPQKSLEQEYGDIWNLLKAVLLKLEKDTMAAVGDYLGDNWRDNLMELLMTRFELAQQHRDVYASLPRSFAKNPQQSPRFAKQFYKYLDNTLRTAGIEKKLCQPACVVAFGAVYLSLVDVWMRDETADLSKTMAAIDKRTGMMEQGFAFLNRQPDHNT
jgi:AcrR family transcriptional regulator